MITEEVRPISEIERSTLQARLNWQSPVGCRGSVKALLLCLGGMILSIAVIAILIVLAPNPFISGTIGGVIGLVGLVCLYGIIAILQAYFRWQSASRRFRQKIPPLIVITLHSGMVLSKRVTATKVIEIAEYEDEGSGYIFGIGDDQSLFLKGQWVYPEIEGMPWPCSDFEIVRSTDKKLMIGIFCSGSELSPIRVVETTECNDEIVWADKEEIILKPPEALLADILKSR